MKNFVMSCNLIIFGTKSDLARRKIFPALYQLEKMNLIHPDTRIIGIGRAQWNLQSYIYAMKKSLEIFLKKPIENDIWEIFSKRLDFYNLDIDETSSFKDLKSKINKKISIYYLAMPSIFSSKICEGLSKIDSNNSNNLIVMEKPIGENLNSSRLIHKQVSKYFNKNQIYRVDHYLNKETILNLLSFRFANTLFMSNWNKNFIDHIQITVAENIGIENRWKYFDKIGQTRDMIQSHLLQILSILTMSPPTYLTSKSILQEKIKIFQSLRPITEKTVHEVTVIGQYTSGIINGKKVPGYLEEKGSNKNSQTETFVSIRVNIDNWCWSGVPFYLRTGKRLMNTCSEIVIYFKNPPVNLFYGSYKNIPKNKIIIRLQPNAGIDIFFTKRMPNIDHTYCLQSMRANSNFFSNDLQQKKFLDAYEKILLEIMRYKKNEQAFFIFQEEIEETWKWIDSILYAWKQKNYLPKPYKAGTYGPIDSMNMIQKDGRVWERF